VAWPEAAETQALLAELSPCVVRHDGNSAGDEHNQT
jgi:hypothetical protein